MNLDRFTQAQSGVYAHALAELREGRKTGHWMWFIFPQLKGLGGSPTARHFAIANSQEAAEYMRHPMLGPRLIDCARAVLRHEGTPIEDILGEVDALKLRSCATLFGSLEGADPAFGRILETFYSEACPGTRFALSRRGAA